VEDLAGRPVWTLLPGWSPFYEASVESRLRLTASRTSIPVRVSGQALHLLGETLFVLDVCRLSAAAQPAPAEAIMVTDRRGEILHVNPAYEAMTGYSGAELAGLTPAVLKSGAHDDHTYRELWGTILDGDTYHGVFVNRRKNGELYHEDKVIRPVPDARGRPILFLSLGCEVTAWMGAREAQPERCAAL